MTTGQPKTIGSEVLQRVGDLLDAHDVSPFEIASLERDAKKLVAVEPGNGHIALAAVAALRWDVVAAEDAMRKAVQREPELTNYLNAVAIAGYLNRMELANVLIAEAISMFSLDSQLVDKVIGARLAVADVEGAAEVFKEAVDKINYQGTNTLNPARILAGIEELGISSDRLKNELQAGFDVLTEHKYRYAALGATLISAPTLDSIVFRIFVHAEQEAILKLEGALAERLVDLPEWDPRTLSVEYNIAENAHSSA